MTDNSAVTGEHDAAASDGVPLLSIDDLAVEFHASHLEAVRAVRGISFELQKGESLGVVGESGCGKSTAAMALLRALPEGGVVTSGRIAFRGKSLLSLSERAMQDVRGDAISMIFQDPVGSLNPVLTIGMQLIEQLRAHRDITHQEAERRAIDLLRMVGIPAPASRIKAHPHELSGGMNQRVMIAMAASCEPDLLIADEPTTALDVTVQAQILDLLADMRQRLSMGLILITHDVGVVARCADRIAVMYAGRIVEEGPTDTVLSRPSHPYTAALIASSPRIDLEQREAVEPIPGQPPDMRAALVGCAFAPRCVRATEECRASLPPMVELGDDQRAECVHPITA